VTGRAIPAEKLAGRQSLRRLEVVVINDCVRVVEVGWVDQDGRDEEETKGRSRRPALLDVTGGPERSPVTAAHIRESDFPSCLAWNEDASRAVPSFPTLMLAINADAVVSVLSFEFVSVACASIRESPRTREEKKTACEAAKLARDPAEGRLLRRSLSCRKKTLAEM
jgi:hypothetical protein